MERVMRTAESGRRGSEIGTAAAGAVSRTVAAGREAYDRERHLPRIIPVGPEELADRSEQGRTLILRKLARALRAERNRGRAGHWTYDLNRHIALSQAYAAERGGASRGL
jgi:hypothetical protein